MRQEKNLWLGWLAKACRRRENGYLLMEYIVLLGLLGLFFMLAMPKLTWDSHRYAVDVMTREIAADLQRMRQHSLTNGTADMDGWTLSLRKDKYVIMQRYTVHKTRIYPEGITIPTGKSGRKDFTFDGKGRPQSDMELTVASSGAQPYEKKIIVAAQTGRIRIE